MSRLLLSLICILFADKAFSATFGSVTTVVGSVSDIVLDESRRRLYLVNSSQNRVEIYSLPPNPIRLISSIPTDPLPLAAAISRDNRLLYISAHNSSSLNIINLDSLTVSARPSLPARPEGIAVGNDDRVLITTIGTGPNNSQNTLLIYDPGNASISTVVVVPPAPQNPLLPPPSGRAFLTNRSQLQTTPDGNYIVGVNIPNNNTRVVFVYEVASGTVLRSRSVNNISSVLAISPDGRKFTSGLTMFDTETLEVLAQQNLANAPYPIQPGTNFNLQQNQGGSVFAADGSLLYSAFNVAPVQNPPARPNVSQLMLNDPDNLLIHLALQMPENLAGKMVITSDGSTLYALSESGFTSIPLGNARQNPILDLPSSVVLLANDQCGVTADQRRASIQVQNTGRGRLTATAQVLQLNPTGPGGLGGAGGPGGGLPGGGIVIILPPVLPGGGQTPAGPQLPGGLGGGGQNTPIFQTAPQVRTQQTPDGPVIDLTYNTVNNRTLGTVSPVHDFLIQSSEAINIPPRLRVFQNNRDAEARADVRPVPVGISANEALEDIVYDPVRNRVYIANSGKNRIEVFDARAREFLEPVKVGQLPRSMALMPDNNTLYVANSGGENISIVDLSEGRVVGRVRFPPLPFNATTALITPSVIAPSERGPLIIMNNGTIWRVVGNEVIPRTVSPVIGSNTVQAPRYMVATPNGEYVMLLAGNGFVYLYDAAADEFINGRQIFSNPIQGYYGPVGAGPGGRYFLVNGTVLNPALTPTGSAGSVVLPQGPGGGGAQQQQLARPVSAVIPLNQTTFLRFTQPVRVQQNNPLVSDAPVIELADANTGNMMRSVSTVEGPISIQTGAQRVNVSGRMMAVDPASATAYLLTTSGLSIVPLEFVLPNERPQVSQNGVVNVANLGTSVATGSLVSINGRNLGASASSADAPLPNVLGGTCVTINNRPMPLLAASADQIKAQIPPDLAPGRYPIMIRNIDRKASSLAPAQVTVSKYAPAVIVDPQTRQAAIYHADGRPVNRQNPATRDQRLVLYAIGLGATKGGTVRTGQPAPESPPAVTDPVSVFFGDPRYREAGVVVEWSGLVPGLVGLYQINLYVPGDRIRGDDLDVTVRIGGVDSPTKGEMDPKVSIR
ncbi:MAG: beta-propeller fold lactonase family protein [Acidobacteria bacterium]|nr:beta-propeller fold lactonase family protein [Acidobacteriota bacterium]